MCRLSRNPGALTSRTPQGHVGLFQGYFTFSFYLITTEDDTKEGKMQKRKIDSKKQRQTKSNLFFESPIATLAGPSGRAV
jgi:hypothetical protein